MYYTPVPNSGTLKLLDFISISYASIGLHGLLDPTVKLANAGTRRTKKRESKYALSKLITRVKISLGMLIKPELRLKITPLLVKSSINSAYSSTKTIKATFCTVLHATGSLGAAAYNHCETTIQIITCYVELTQAGLASLPNQNNPTGGSLNYENKEDALNKCFEYAKYIKQSFPLSDTINANNQTIQGIFTKLAELQTNRTSEQ